MQITNASLLRRFCLRVRLTMRHVQYVRYKQNPPGNPRGCAPTDPVCPEIPWHAFKDPHEAIKIMQRCHKSRLTKEHLLCNAKHTVPR